MVEKYTQNWEWSIYKGKEAENGQFKKRKFQHKSSSVELLIGNFKIKNLRIIAGIELF